MGLLPRSGHSSLNAIAVMVGRQGLEPWTLGLKERAGEFT
jgi:hypothetical protein